jgi:hypothetical protein
MGSQFLIPTQPFNQKFSISLGGIVYNIKLRWNGMNGSWIMDVSDQSSNAIATGIPLITGDDLFGQLQYLGIGGNGMQLFVQSTFDPNQVPDYTSLGSTGNLYALFP